MLAKASSVYPQQARGLPIANHGRNIPTAMNETVTLVFPCIKCESILQRSVSWINPSAFKNPSMPRGRFAMLCPECSAPNVLILEYTLPVGVKIVDRLPASSVYGLYKLREERNQSEQPTISHAEPAEEG